MCIYTLSVFGTQYVAVKRLRTKTLITRRGYGIQGWNPKNSHEPRRLKGSGSFTFAGMYSARRAAMKYLSQPAVHQVAVKTDSGKNVYRYFKHLDGTISGYYGGSN